MASHEIRKAPQTALSEITTGWQGKVLHHPMPFPKRAQSQDVAGYRAIASRYPLWTEYSTLKR